MQRRPLSRAQTLAVHAGGLAIAAALTVATDSALAGVVAGVAVHLPWRRRPNWKLPLKPVPGLLRIAPLMVFLIAVDVEFVYTGDAGDAWMVVALLGLAGLASVVPERDEERDEPAQEPPAAVRREFDRWI